MSIRPTGGYFELDEDGCVINPTSLDKITAPWDDIVARVVRACRTSLAEQLHSLYIRGSVPCGTAVVGVSDVDMFAILKGNEPGPRGWVDELDQELQQVHQFKPQLDMALYSLEGDVATNPRLQMVVKTQSLCVHGPDLRAGMPGYRPGPDMMLNVYWIAHDVEESRRKLRHAHEAGEIQALCRLVTKAMVRCGFEIVMEREGRYTNSLYYCYRSFSKYYPAHEGSMRTCLEMFLDPTPDRARLLSLLQRFGGWLVEETARQYGHLMKS